MEWSITTYIAIYGSLLSTAALVWNIYNKYTDKGKVKITGFFADILLDPWIQDEETVLTYRVVNSGTKPIVITKIGVKYKKDKQRSQNEGIVSMNGYNINKILNPGEFIDEVYTEYNTVDDKIKYLYVMDSLGNKFKMKRKDYSYLLKQKKEL